MELKRCPKCHKQYNQRSAISRVDNHTQICPVCATTESIVQFNIYGTKMRVDSLTDIEKKVRKTVIMMNTYMAKAFKDYYKSENAKRSKMGQKMKELRDGN